MSCAVRTQPSLEKQSKTRKRTRSSKKQVEARKKSKQEKSEEVEKQLPRDHSFFWIGVRLAEPEEDPFPDVPSFECNF